MLKWNTSKNKQALVLINSFRAIDPDDGDRGGP
jgi:hypothetical protein